MILILMSYLLGMVSKTVRYKDINSCKITFMEHSDDIDVLFLGTSHMINAVFPMELWNEYGIASYNFGGHGNTIPNSYWTMMNALDYADPELVVIDCLGISDDIKTTEDYAYFHWSMDVFPLSKTKIDTVNDLFDNPLKKSEYLWDFSFYHNRWNELTESDFNEYQYDLYGAEARIGVTVPEEMTDFDMAEQGIADTNGTVYLRKIIEECQDRNIDVLLTYLPFPATETGIRESSAAEDIAKKYGINYINFFKKDVVNYDTDCYDESHLNPSGAGKVTSYLGDYIQSNYGIEDHRENESYQDWNEDYRSYQSFKTDLIKEQTDLSAYLILLRDQEISMGLYLKGGSEISEKKEIHDLLCNIPVDKNIENLDQAMENGEDYFLFIDHKNKNISEYVKKDNTWKVFDQSQDNINSIFRNINLSSDESDAGQLSNVMSDAQLYIFVIDQRTDEIIDAVVCDGNNDCKLEIKRTGTE